MVAIEKTSSEMKAGSTSPSLPLLRLLQLCSVNMPVGAYTFSQGLETAVDQGWLTNYDETHKWLQQVMTHSIALCDLPVLQRQLNALSTGDDEQFSYWNNFVLACRETNELRLTDTAQGLALMRVLGNLEIEHPLASIRPKKDISFVSAFALAAHHWNIEKHEACLGYAWAWLENHVASATKLVPLGQTQAQQLLQDMQPHIVQAIEQSEQCSDAEIGSSMPALAIASCWHEHQYSRLFRS